MRLGIFFSLFGVAGACTDPYYPPVQTGVVVQANVVAPPAHDHADAAGHVHALVTGPIVLTPQASRVLILQSTHLTRPSEVVGIVDVHLESGRQDEALDALRAEAAAMGADAVVGVEFHHGEAHEGPTHLSGLGVRFIEPSYLPQD